MSAAETPLPRRVRPSRADEAPALGESGARAFRVGDAAGWASYFRDHGHLAPDDTLVIERDGALAAHASALRLTLSLAGQELPVRGLAAVSVAPEQRRQGLASALVAAWLRRMQRKREPLAMLYPFRDPFYRRAGYAPCEWAEAFELRPAELPASPLARRVRALDRSRDAAALVSAYDRWRAGRTGPLARSDYWWTVRVLARVGDGAVYINPDGALDGYVLYSVPPESAYGVDQVLRVKELVAATPDAHRALLGFLRNQGEQFTRIQCALARGEAPPWLDDYGTREPPPPVGTYHTVGRVVAGAMARIVDVAAALALHPSARSARGRLGLELADPVLPARRYDIAFTASGPRVSRGESARARLALGVGALTQVYLGAASARALRTHGLITGHPSAAALLDEALAGPPLFLSPLNAF